MIVRVQAKRVYLEKGKKRWRNVKSANHEQSPNHDTTGSVQPSTKALKVKRTDKGVAGLLGGRMEVEKPGRPMASEVGRGLRPSEVPTGAGRSYGVGAARGRRGRGRGRWE